MNLEPSTLGKYYLQIADASLILGHRLSEWCGHGPILEEDIALTNIALDLTGQARSIYQQLSVLENKGNEDDWAYLRDVFEYKNPLLVELPNGHFGDTLMRQFLFDVFHKHFLKGLQASKDAFLSAYAEKSLKEVTYHTKHSSNWIIRLGDGTEESHKKIQESLDDVWMYTGELFEMTEVDTELLKQGISVDLSVVKQAWQQEVEAVLAEATLQVPKTTWMQTGGKKGIHTEHLGFILADLQFLRRAYPDAKEW